MLLLMSSRPSYFDDFTFVREKSGTTVIVDKALRKLVFWKLAFIGTKSSKEHQQAKI